MAASAAMVISCFSNQDHSSSNDKKQSVPAMANPAAGKCVNDGFVLKAIMENGVTKEYLCINPETGKSCEIWKYYHNECSIK